jgi:hypothetical protein
MMTTAAAPSVMSEQSWRRRGAAMTGFFSGGSRRIASAVKSPSLSLGPPLAKCASGLSTPFL